MASEKEWVKLAEEKLVGRRIVAVRYMTAEEQNDLGWPSRPIVLGLDNGSLIYPQSDDEGNDGGALFGQDKDGKELGFPVLRR
jgi:hypothetical protein